MKKTFWSLGAGLMLLGMTSAAHAQTGKTMEWKEAKSGGYTYKYVTNDPTKSRFYTLDNGLTVILSPDPAKPRIQTYVAVKAGSKTDPASHTGLAHYLEHLLFKGTDKFGSLDYAKEKPLLASVDSLYEVYNKTTDATQRKLIYHYIDSVSGEASKFAIANEYDKMMGSMGAEGTNAFTSFEQTVYVEDIPANAVDKYLAVQAERFRNPVFRIFHTELEAVYEEKNISLDNDGRKSIEKLFELMFPNNNYGKQTTIGTVEHLKNPSILAIRQYFNTYYVPNNMGVIMSGDFNPDVVIAKIDKDFKYMKAKPIPAYTFEAEKSIAAPISASVLGPNPESILIGYRFPGASTADARKLNLLGQILTNGSAGMIDLNLVKQQKLLGAGAFPYVLKDYSMLILQGNPNAGQSLDEVKSLILGQIDKLKKGDFSEDLISAIINNEKKSLIAQNEEYSSRASNLMDNFTSGTDWRYQVAYLDELGKISKADIVKFANEYLGNNYVAIYKRQGEDKGVVKVEKPIITPVSVNRDAQSPFLMAVNNMPESDVAPQWLDFKTDITRAKSGNREILAVQNKDNSLFRLNYYYETGSWSDKILPLAAGYLEYIGTNNKSADQVSKDFYKLASSFNINVGDERTYITLDGLNENLGATVSLFEDLLKNAKANPEVLEAYKGQLKKSRSNAKEDKRSIMRGLISYAKYGANNPYNHVLTDKEIDALTADQLVGKLRDLLSYPHQVLYYGPTAAPALATMLTRLHPETKKMMALPTQVRFPQMDQDKTKVLFANYKMVQAEVFWIKNTDAYNEAMAPTNSLFNQYFGGGMGSVVFQTIRESKALAYSTYANITQPTEKDLRNSVTAYVGTQADKLPQAVAGMNELLNDLPQSDKALTTAKEGLRKSLATDRITKDGILFSYLSAKRMGRDFDIRKSIYDKSQTLQYINLKNYHDSQMSKAAFTYCVVADEARVPETELSKIGKVTKLDLDQIFGY